MRIKLLILSIIVAAGFSFADDAVLFGNVLETDLILTPEGVTNAILTTALTAESDPVAYPVATNALAVAEGALQADATNGLPVAVAHAQSAHGLTDNGGFAGGDGAYATYGGAVGYYAYATYGGGAVGAGASATDGGAMGAAAVTSSGFAGGFQAIAALDETGHDQPIDAIQLGTGWNPDANTMQVYSYKLMNADGSIPAERMATTLSGYATTGAVAAVQAEVGAGTNWLTRTGLSGTVAFANDGNRPQAWSGTGALTVSGFTGLTPPTQVYWTLQGFDSVTLPAGIYAVGGGTWQTGMVNHFALWQVAGKTMITFLTATEIE